MKTKLFFLSGLLTLLYGCYDFIEADLSNSSVTIITPANNTVSSYFSQHFKWEETERASEYELQIVRPSFSAIQQFVLDTVTTETELSFTLTPGTYQWRLRAKNSTSATDYVTYNLTIDSTLDLSGQTVVLTSPADNLTSNSYTQAFSWTSMPNAEAYIFQVLFSGSVIETQTLTATNTSYTFSFPGSFQWRVFAQNSSGNSAYSTRTIHIDVDGPAAPVITFPLANDTASNPVMLAWTSDIGSVLDSVYIYADTNLTILVQKAASTTQAHSFTGTVNEDYFWRVRSKDAAGNWSPYSSRRKFSVNP